MRIRKPIVGILIAASIMSFYLGTADISLKYDKIIHFCVFYFMTMVFYNCIETKNKGQLRLATFIICTLCAGIGSEFFQSIFPHRTFDFKDIICNILGSLSGILSCDIYSRYMLYKRHLMRMALIKSIGDQGESLAETNINQENEGNTEFAFLQQLSLFYHSNPLSQSSIVESNKNIYTDYENGSSNATSNRTSMSGILGLDEDYDYQKSYYDEESMIENTGNQKSLNGRARKGTTSIELKNVAPIPLNE